MTKLETAFQEAICTETAAFGDEIQCGCQQIYKREDPEDSPIQYGVFSGHVIVKGCGCPFSSSFGGMLWGHRHAVARFLRGMGQALRMDIAEVESVLPAELGKECE